ncbi:MAG: UPF0280 family protein [Candidatus Odyssella sp.]|nr:UPF0280 family protein [Candidatus Odyssella sp.]
MTLSARSGAARAPLSGQRWHFQHGPIDLVLRAWGDAEECAAAYAQAWVRFETVLPELVSELPLLRQPVAAPSCSLPRSGRDGAQAMPLGHCLGSEGRSRAAGAVPAETPFPHLPSAREVRANGPLLAHFAGEEKACPPSGPVARRMWRACAPFADQFITPMAAVAGAVADEVLAAMIAGRTLAKAYVNNGGDIAIHLAPGERFETGIVGDIGKPKLSATASVAAEDGVRGIATSGWRGRSFSLGIADAVTVLARDAAAADAAATMIANAVTTDHPAIERRPARDLDPDSDLREHPVTVSVGPLDAAALAAALANGERAARAYRAAGLLEGAYIELQGRRVAVGGTHAPAAIRDERMAWSLHA